MTTSSRIKVEMYILFSCSAWHEYSLFEPKTVFSSIEKAAGFLRKNRRKLKLEGDGIECFRQHGQTQGRNTSYLVQSCLYNPVRARDLERQGTSLVNNHIKRTTMTNGENTYIGMSLPEGTRHVTVFERDNFENCGGVSRTLCRTEDRVRELLVLGNPLHLGGSLSSDGNKASCRPLSNGNSIRETKEISGKEESFLFGDWTYLYENGRWPLGYEGKIYKISDPEFSVSVPDKDRTPSPLDKGLSFAVISETGKPEFTPEVINGWGVWKSPPERVSEKGKTVYVFHKTQLIKAIKLKKLESRKKPVWQRLYHVCRTDSS